MTKEKNIEDEIFWSVQQMERHIWCLNCRNPEYAEELHDRINAILWSNDIEPLFTSRDEQDSRYVTVIDVDPHWVFVTKTIQDGWNYNQYIEELADIYRDKDES